MTIRQQRYNEYMRLADHALAAKKWVVYRYWMKMAEEWKP